MPTFIATVKTLSGATQTLEREAQSQAALLGALRAEGFVPVRVQVGGSRPAGQGGKLFAFGFSRKPGRKQIQAFMNNFAALLRSGMDLERSLKTLEKEAAEPLRGVLQTLAERVRQGEPLSAAMARTNVFNPFHVNVIKAGEYGGNLTGALQRISQSIEREMELRSRIRNAVAYPAFLICFGLLSMAVMMLFVLPKFLKIYQEMKADLPLITSLMLKTSAFLQVHAIWIIPLLGVAVGGSLRYLFRFRENLSADRLRMGLPLIGTIVRNVETATFLRTLGLLIQSGIPVVQALQVYTRIAGSAIFLKAAQEIEKGVQMGSKLSSEMRRQEIFAESTLNLVAVGEESGQLDGLLMETSDRMEKQVDDLVRTLLTFLEPLLIVIVGIIIGALVISMLLPIFRLSAAIRGR
jgi:type II secretory pathway component PulF